MRILRHDRSHKRLYFTTTLQHAVQSFALRDGKLLEPAAQHPNPPTAFAVSPTSDVLLSSSTNPTTIYLTSILPGRIPLLLQPTCCALPVAAAAFHPAREIFALAFTDGTVSAYDVVRLRQNLASSRPSQCDNGEIGHVLNLHQVVVDADGLLASVTAVAFVASTALTSTVSIGLDAKCHVVGFERPGLATISQSWQLPTSARTLAVTQSSSNPVVAIGLANGEVRLYTLDAKTIYKKSFESRVLAIEWMDSGSGQGASQPSSKASSGIVIRKRKTSSVRSAGRRRNASSRRGPVPAVPPRPPIPKEGGKLAQQQAVRASTESRSSASMPLSSEGNTLSTSSAHLPKPKGKKIIIQTHGRMARKKPQSLAEPALPAPIPTNSLTPHSSDTILDWGPPNAKEAGRPLSPHDSSQTSSHPSESFQSIISSWSSSSRDSPKFLPALTSSQASSAPRPVPKSLPFPLLPHSSPTAHAATVASAPPPALPPASSDSSRLAARPSDRQSIITATTESTGTVIDWTPQTSQKPVSQTLAVPLTDHAVLSESPETSSGSFVFRKPQQPSHKGAEMSGLDASSESDRAATPRATGSSASTNVNGPYPLRARRASSTTAAVGATPRSWFPSGRDSAISPMLLQAVFEEEFALFQTRIMLELRDQRECIESFMSEQVSMLQLGEENRRLREELARMRNGSS